MARGKRSSGKNYTSQGERRNVAKAVVKANRRDYIENRGIERLANQYKAWKRGKRVSVTIANPDKNNTKERYIKVDGHTAFRTKQGK
jgi:hypothetical protein